MVKSSAVFNAYSRYYDLLYKDKDYESEARYVQTLLESHGVEKGDLLEFGSGTGKHGCLLASNGYSVHGIEQSLQMVEQARLEAGFTCQVGDIRNVELERDFNAVLALFHVVSYQIRNEDLIAVFNSAFRHLQKGGLFIFDFWYTPAVYSQKPTVRVKRISDFDVEVIRLAEPVIYSNENRVDVNYTIFARDVANGRTQIITESHPMRHFSLPEINLLAAMQGFHFIDAHEFLTGKATGDDTWGVCVTLKRA